MSIQHEPTEWDGAKAVRERVLIFATRHRLNGSKLLPTFRAIAIEYEAMRRAHHIDQSIIRDLFLERHRVERLLHRHGPDSAIAMLRAVMPHATESQIRRLLEHSR
ncbi:MAG TPA: hypothetical protein VFG22_01995 [Polyangiales bacterium]|nr:hypothetical protein [Polyangiales bacterium]